MLSIATRALERFVVEIEKTILDARLGRRLCG